MAARINGVIETSDRIRQSYQPKPPRVVIDTSYVEQAHAPTLDEIDQFAGAHAGAPVEALHDNLNADLPAQGHETFAEGAPHKNASEGVGERLISGTSVPQSEEGWRQLAQHFMAEARNEKAARLEVETLCEEAVRCAEEAQSEVAKLRQAGTGDNAADDKRIAEANLREADARKREAEALMREAAAREEAETQRQLAARAENVTKHAQSARREAETKRDEAFLRLAQLQSELKSAREGAVGREALALAQSEASAREDEARLKIEAQQKQIESQRAEIDAVRKTLDTLARDADGQRRKIETLDAARIEAETTRDAARRQIAEIEKRLEMERQSAGDRDAMARRENEARTAEATARCEAEESRELAAQLRAALEAERAKLAEHISELEKQRAEAAKLKTQSETLKAEAAKLKAEAETLKADATKLKAETETLKADAAKLKAEAETQRSEAARHRTEAERLNAEAKSEASQRKAATAKAGELTAELTAARNELNALRAAGTLAGADVARLEEARAREAALRAELETLRGEVQRLEQAAQKAELARSQANELRLAAELTGAEARGALEAVRETARSREATLERQVGELMKQVANLESAARAAPDHRSGERSTSDAGSRDGAANERSEAETPSARVYKADPLARTSSAARFVEPRNAPPTRRESSVSTSARDEAAVKKLDPAVAASTDVADEGSADETQTLAIASEDATTEPVPASGAEKRRAKRVPASIPATIWGRGMAAAMACTIRDKSSSGALLEFVLDRYKERVTGIGVGDQLTLTINTSKERTTVPCVVVRIDGRKAGVRFNGQFRTEMVKQKKTAKAEAQEKKSAAVQLTKSLFGSGR